MKGFWRIANKEQRRRSKQRSLAQALGVGIISIPINNERRIYGIRCQKS